MPLIPVEQTSPSGYVPLPPDIIVDDRTGQPPLGAEVLSLEGMFMLAPCPESTGDPGLQMSLVGAILGGIRDWPRSITSYRNMIVFEAPFGISVTPPAQELEPRLLIVRTRWFPQMVPVVEGRTSSDPPNRVEEKLEQTTQAEELRSISGLPPAMLAQLFGVSRTTYYKWIDGATPRGERFRHLVDVLSHVKEAQRRLSASVDLASWLRTPVSAGGKTPLDYLQQRRFSTFRGLLLRAKSASVALSTPLPSALASRPLSRSEFEVARERLSPSPRSEEEFEEDATDHGIEGDDRR